MTRKEAVDFLEKCRWWFEPFTSEKEQWNEALDIAIEALTQESTQDLISRQDAIRAVFNTSIPFSATGRTARQMKGLKRDAVGMIKSLPSANPRTEGVLCALADRTCPFQGKEFAWCLTCPHISDEDRDLVKRAIEPKTGEWIQDDDYICDQCGYHMIVGGGAYNYCPNCGADMRGKTHE